MLARKDAPVSYHLAVTVDDAAHQASFSGHVVVDRETMRLTADKVLVEYGEGGISDITAFRARFKSDRARGV